MPAAPCRPRPTRRPPASAPAALLVAAVLAGCMVEQSPEAALRAAQADSAAAGYSVGLADGAEPASHIRLDTLLAWVRRHVRGADPADSTRVPVVAMAPPVPVGGRRRDPAVAVDTAPTATPIDSVRPPSPDSAARPRPVAADSATSTTTSAQPAVDSLLPAGDFLAYNPARRTVQLRAVAGHNGVNESLNFNGAVRGSRTVVVPLGWRVEVAFRQGDEALAHSALVAIAQDPMPVDAPPPAFPDATTRRPTDGIIHGGSDAFAFTAEHAGRYVLQCGVPGHAQAGMWLRLVVDSTATTPRYR
jgi:sulfocyanin